MFDRFLNTPLNIALSLMLLSYPWRHMQTLGIVTFESIVRKSMRMPTIRMPTTSQAFILQKISKSYQ